MSHAQIPRGVADHFWSEAAARRDLEQRLMSLFRTWGYQDVIPPTFEYAETFQQRANPRLQDEMYRFLDRDGSTLSLRVDMTIPIARLVGVRLHDWPMPQRFCYAGSVFRYTEPQAGRQREFSQAGFELVGAQTPEADAEVIALTVRAVQEAGVSDFRLVLGQIHYFDGLMRDLDLSTEQASHLQRAINRNSEADLADFLRDTPLTTQQRHSLEQLPQLSGGDALTVIGQADRLCLNYAMHEALDNLRRIHTFLHAYGVADAVYLDLTEINNLGYYTGITFEVLVPCMGFAVGSGGRYDNLVGSFGPSQPAVGVALGLDRILAAARGGWHNSQTKPLAPDLIVSTRHDPVCLQIVDNWRRSGLRVEVAVDEQASTSLYEAAVDRGIPLAASWTGQDFLVWRTDIQIEQAERILADDAQRVVDLVNSDETGAGAIPMKVRKE